MAVTRKTYAELGRAISAAYDQAELNALFFEYLFDDPNSSDSKLKRSIRFVGHLEQRRSNSSDKECLEIAEKILQKGVYPHTELRILLEIDGYKFQGEHLIPTTPGVAALAPQISLIESELKEPQFATAARHYEQTVESFKKGHWESSNGQLRSFLEDLIPLIAEAETGSTSNDPSAAFQLLKRDGFLDREEFNQFRAFWAGIQDNGPHAGLSSDSEALFRLHMGTCIARYLLEKCAARHGAAADTRQR